MSGLWSEAGFPHRGWQCIEVKDLGQDGTDYPPGTCEACGRDDLRYVHTLRNRGYDRDVETGCVCASKLEEDKNAPRERETQLKNVAGRRSRWLSRNWNTSRNDNAYLNIEGHNVGVFYRYRKWKYWIKNRRDEFVGHSGQYETEKEAKLALFEELAKRLRW